MSHTNDKKDLTVVVDGWLFEALRSRGNVKSLKAIVSDSWFGSVALYLADRYRGFGFLPWLIAYRRCDRIVAKLSARGFRSFLLFRAVLGWKNRKLYLVEFRLETRRGRLNNVKYAIRNAVYGWAMRKALTGAAVSQAWECQVYSAALGVPLERFSFIPYHMVWDSIDRRDTFKDIVGGRITVLSSGRASCDWETMLAAARDASWDLRVVCSKSDWPLVEKLNIDRKATVLSEISSEEHDRLLREATVFALVLKEENVSSGQVRLAKAIGAGVPVVATRVRGLDGYLDDGINALVVPAGDSVALRATLDELVSDPELRARLRDSAYEMGLRNDLATRIQRMAEFALG